LIRRKQETPLGQQALYAHIQEGPAASAAAATPLGTSGGVLKSGSTIPSVLTTTTFTMPVAGTYVVVTIFNGSAASASTLTPGANITGLNLLTDNSASAIAASAGGDGLGVAVYTVSQNGTGAGNTVTLGNVTSLASGKTDIFICQISSGATLALRKPSTNQIVDAFAALCERFDGLEKKLSQSQNTLISVVSEPDTPFEEEKGTELQSSVHISRSTAQQLLRGLGLKK